MGVRVGLLWLHLRTWKQAAKRLDMEKEKGEHGEIDGGGHGERAGCLPQNEDMSATQPNVPMRRRMPRSRWEEIGLKRLGVWMLRGGGRRLADGGDKP